MVAVDAVSVATFLAWAGFNRRSRKQTKRVERREDRWVVIFWFPVRGCVLFDFRFAARAMDGFGRLGVVGGPWIVQMCSKCWRRKDPARWVMSGCGR